MISLNEKHTGAVQSGHMRKLISAFVSQPLESILVELDTCKFQL